MSFPTLNQFLQTAVESFFFEQNAVTNLDTLSPRIPDLLYRAVGSFGSDELARIDPSLFDYLTRGSSDRNSELITHGFANPEIYARVMQILFTEHCAKLLGGMNFRLVEQILNETHEIIASLPSGTDWGALVTIEGFGWIVTHPEFAGSLFFLPNLYPPGSRVLLHQVPKTGGTSINNFLSKTVPDAVYQLYPCSNFTTLSSFYDGIFHGVNLFIKLVSEPRKTVVYCGHYNLTDVIRRANAIRIRCVSQFGDPIRLLSSGLRYCLSKAASDRFFARKHGLTDADTTILTSIIRNGAWSKSVAMRDVVDRMLASDGFKSHFRDPLARWYLTHDGKDFDSQVAVFESVVALMDTFVLYEQPSERILVDLGLAIKEAASIERDNVSLFSSSALATLLGGDDWLSDRFRMHDLIGCSDTFYQYLLSHHSKRAS